MLWVNWSAKENCFAVAITGFHCRRHISPEAIILLPPTIATQHAKLQMSFAA